MKTANITTTYRRDPNAPFGMDDVMATLTLIYELQRQEMQHISMHQVDEYRALQTKKENALIILNQARDLMRQGQLIDKMTEAQGEKLRAMLDHYEAFYLDALHALEHRFVASQLYMQCLAKAHEELGKQEGVYQVTGEAAASKIPPLTIHALT